MQLTSLPTGKVLRIHSLLLIWNYNVPTGLGQALFPPDGTKHVRYNGISSTEGDYVTIYDFD